MDIFLFYIPDIFFFVSQRIIYYIDKRIQRPKSVILNSISIKVVDEFKLLGVTIDNKLNFERHVSNIGLTINSKLFTIKRIFYLSTSVKIQFFKTFLLSYFDYCSTVFIYFSKQAIQKIFNKYYLCLSKLFKIDFSNFSDICEINEYLMKKFNIPAFQHRLLQRIALFSYKILNFTSAPCILIFHITTWN